MSKSLLTRDVRERFFRVQSRKRVLVSGEKTVLDRLPNTEIILRANDP